MGLMSPSARLLACHSRPLWGQTSLSFLLTLDSPLGGVCVHGPTSLLLAWSVLPACTKPPSTGSAGCGGKGSGPPHSARKLHVPPAQEPEGLVCVALHLLLGSKLTCGQGTIGIRPRLSGPRRAAKINTPCQRT